MTYDDRFVREAELRTVDYTDKVWEVTVVDDDGVHEVANPRLSQRGMDQQVQLQQRVSRAKRGSKEWKRRCKTLRSFKHRQANRRLDEQHKLSARIAADTLPSAWRSSRSRT